MRVLLLMVLMTTPALADNACEKLARAICPSGDTMGECLSFVDNEMRTPEGERMSGVNRLMGCQLALDDEATQTDYRTRMRAQAETRWYTMQVTVKPRKADGTSWDAREGAPDIAACLTVGEESAGCEPESASVAEIRAPKCRDAMSCDFKVQARRGTIVGVVVVDVDEAGTDDIGICAFKAGKGSAECSGQLTLTPEGVDAPAAGGVVDQRLIGRWEFDVEGTMSHIPGFKDLTVEERRQAIDQMSTALGESYVEFAKDGQATAKVGEDVTEGTYVITGLKGKVLTIEMHEGEKVETVEVTVTERGLVMKEGKKVIALKRR